MVLVYWWLHSFFVCDVVIFVMKPMVNILAGKKAITCFFTSLIPHLKVFQIIFAYLTVHLGTTAYFPTAKTPRTTKKNGAKIRSL